MKKKFCNARMQFRTRCCILVVPLTRGLKPLTDLKGKNCLRSSATLNLRCGIKYNQDRSRFFFFFRFNIGPVRNNVNRPHLGVCTASAPSLSRRIHGKLFSVSFWNLVVTFKTYKNYKGKSVSSIRLC